MTGPVDVRHLGLMLALTFSTGVVDAVGYLGLDRVFTGNMTGNVAILGMALAGGAGLPVVGPLVALAGFLAGAGVAGRVLRRAPAGWSPTATAVLGTVTALLTGVAVTLLVVGRPHGPATDLVTAVLGLAMGAQAAAARAIAVPEVTTVALTSTIVGLAAGPFGELGRASGATRLLAVGLLLTGAATGALLVRLDLGLGIVLAAGICLVVTVTGLAEHRTSRRA